MLYEFIGCYLSEKCYHTPWAYNFVNQHRFSAMTKVTLLTACYNSASTIGDTLLSVNAQTYPNIEHIIIDGASSDNTVATVKNVGTRVSKIISEPDKGIYDAYNKGLEHVTGEIVGFINSDDFYCSDSVISKVVEIFEDPDIDACHADLVYVNPKNTNRIERHWKSQKITKRSLTNGVMPAHPTVFFRREVYDRVGNFDLNYRLAADIDFLLRAFFVHEVRSFYATEIWVRMRSGGHTGGGASSILAQNREVRDAQKRHGINCSLPRFYGIKIIDRIAQRVRAPFITAPNLMLPEVKT